MHSHSKLSRHFKPLLISLAVGFATAWFSQSARAQESNAPVNLAAAAVPLSSDVSGDTSLAALNDGYTPHNSSDSRHASYDNWPSTGTQWVEYDWSRPVSTKQIEVYWWDDHRGVRLPAA